MTQNVKSEGNDHFTADYLFIEEVLYLHERGLLEAYREDVIDGDRIHPPDTVEEQNEKLEESQTSGKHRWILLSTCDLYDLMLHKLKIPLAIYLTYAHLRSQTYIVLRHTEHRIEILKQMIQEKDETYNDGDTKVLTDDKESKMLLRHDQFHAKIPHVLRPDNDISTLYDDANDEQAWSRLIAFDAYNPNGTFRKTNPGLPDFLVVICLFNEDSVPFASWMKLVKCCNQIPLRICTVSDGGSVIMFGMSDVEVPHVQS